MDINAYANQVYNTNRGGNHNVWHKGFFSKNGKCILNLFDFLSGRFVRHNPYYSFRGDYYGIEKEKEKEIKGILNVMKCLRATRTVLPEGV